MTFRSRLASASGIQRTPLTGVTLPASRCPTALSLGRRSPTASSPLPSPAADDRPGSTPRRILLATPDAEIPSGVRMALRIRSISASCMRTSMPHPCYERMNDCHDLLNCARYRGLVSRLMRSRGLERVGLRRGLKNTGFLRAARPQKRRKFFPRLPGTHSQPLGGGLRAPDPLSRCPACATLLGGSAVEARARPVAAPSASFCTTLGGKKDTGKGSS
jgi:hypothetical protein